MLRSLNSGVTGLINHQVRMDVIGNNISNVNTVGFKNGRVTFSESFSQMVKGASRSESKAGGTNPMQIGLGVKVGAVDTIVTQGTLTNTNRVFDLAIEGNAFFGVSDGVGTYYTRNGAFQLDAEGYIILPTNGMVLQGKMADSYGNFPPGTAVGNLKIPMTQQAPAKETTFVEIGKNLPSEADAKGQVTYTQRFLHAADGYRAELENGTTDPGRFITPLSSLFTATGQSLNIKDGDVLTFSWTDMPSDAAVGSNTYEITFVVKDPSKQEPPLVDWTDQFIVDPTTGKPTLNPALAPGADPSWTGESAGTGGNSHYVWSLESLRLALNAALNDTTNNGIITRNGTPGISMDMGVSVELSPSGSLTMVPTAGDADDLDYHMFSPVMQTTNPLSGSNVPYSFSFGSGYIGPSTASQGNIDLIMGNYRYSYAAPNGNPGDADYIPWPGRSNAATQNFLRPAEQFDYITDLLTAKGGSLGLEVGDPIDLSGSIGSNNIANSKSGPLVYVPKDVIGGYPDPSTGIIWQPTLLDDLMAKIRNDYILPPDYVDRDGKTYPSVSINGIDGDPNMPFGAIVIRSMKGKDFAINRMAVSAENSNRNSISPTNFINNMTTKTLRAAEDVGIFDTTVEVFDSSGAPHVLTVTFVHTGRSGEWEWHANFAGKEDIIPGTGTGKVFFGQDGTVAAWTFDGGGTQLIVDPNNGASQMHIDLNVGGPGDYRGLTQYASDFTAVVKAQDGYGTGSLIEVSIDEFGLIEGSFSNGTTRAIGQIMVVDFANPGGLLDLSDCIFTVSANSGDPVWGRPMSQSSSSIKPGALEMANVDLGTEFTNMITTQRGYQANSRIVTVSDSMLEELVNLKR